ncbi:MAG: hypothetical protein PUG02_05655 [Selenomonadaceae bacterium]|nr:hypothetical protein [Selenomonadaceae bacterium]
MVVSVIFRGYRGKSYDYLTDLDLVHGDPVAVPTGDLGTGDATCADVEHVAIAQVIRTKRAPPMAKAWVIQKIDMEKFLRDEEGRHLDAMLS